MNPTSRTAKLLLAAIAFGLALASVTPASAAAVWWVTPSLLSIDHVSEGVLLQPNPNRLIHVYRIDPGEAGDHVGNRGRIGVRTTDNGGATWVASATVDPSRWDDRNVAGLVQGEDIQLLYRMWNAPQRTSFGLYGISRIGGAGWGTPTLLRQPPVMGREAFSPSSVVKVPNVGWLGLFYSSANWSQRSVISTDGLTWDFAQSRALPVPASLRTTEGTLAYLGKGQVLAVFRQENHQAAKFYALLSRDGGRTWGVARSISFGRGWVSAPLLSVSADGRRVYLMSAERYGWPGSEANRSSFIRILQSTPSRLALSLGDWSAYGSVPRPWPGDMSLYGYPASGLRPDGRQLVVFTERARDGDGSERANFFQFVLDKAASNPPPPLLSAVVPTRVSLGSPFRVSGRLMTEGGRPVANAPCVLQVKSTTGQWVTKARATTTSRGTWAMTGRAYRTAVWRVAISKTLGGHSCGYGPFTVTQYVSGLR